MMPLYPSTSVTAVPSNTKGPDLPSVGSIDELTVLATQPNSRYVYFDKNADYFYIVRTNENNYKTITRHAYYEDPIPKPEDNYVTKQEIMDLKGDIADVKQSLQQLIEQTRYRPKNKHGKANVQDNIVLCQSYANDPANGYEQPSVANSLSNNVNG